MSPTASEHAWVTLATNDSYALGALVLGYSQSRARTTKLQVIMITKDVSEHMRQRLGGIYNLILDVDILDSNDAENLKLISRPELGITFTKLHCWRLTQFSKCVFLDADTLVLQNADELFEREEFSAAPDAGWPDCFNSGVFVYKPSKETYGKLLDLAVERGSFDGGDQGLLNLYFNTWRDSDINKHLPFTYNMCATATYSYLPAFREFGKDAKIVHFIGASKPWLQHYNSISGQIETPPESEQGHLGDLMQYWWNIFKTDVHSKLTPDMKGVASSFATMNLEGERNAEQLAKEDQMRKEAWESGNIDYMGQDSFENILKKIQTSMEEARLSKEKTPEKSLPLSPNEPIVANTAEEATANNESATDATPQSEDAPQTQPQPEESTPTNEAQPVPEATIEVQQVQETSAAPAESEQQQQQSQAESSPSQPEEAPAQETPTETTAESTQTAQQEQPSQETQQQPETGATASEEAKTEETAPTNDNVPPKSDEAVTTESAANEPPKTEESTSASAQEATVTAAESQPEQEVKVDPPPPVEIPVETPLTTEENLPPPPPPSSEEQPSNQILVTEEAKKEETSSAETAEVGAVEGENKPQTEETIVSPPPPTENLIPEVAAQPEPIQQAENTTEVPLPAPETVGEESATATPVQESQPSQEISKDETPAPTTPEGEQPAAAQQQ